MVGDTPVTVYWTIPYKSCILLISSFCDSSHIVTTRVSSFEFRLRLQPVTDFRSPKHMNSLYQQI